MKTILVTGANGFVGKHLVRELKAYGCEVIGLGYSEPAHPSISGLMSSYINCDLNDAQAVSKLPLDGIDGIINLAGLAQVGDSFTKPELYMKVNVGVLKNLGQELLSRNSKARLLAISTGAVYDSAQHMPLSEDSKVISNGSPYALSKLAMEDCAKQLKSSGLDCVIARPFNHIGLGQASGFLLPDLYSKIVESNKTGQPAKVGSLTTKRDYTDVRDVVNAYASLVLADKLSYGTYNICSGTSHAGQEIFDSLIDAMGLAGKVTVKKDSALLRPNDPPDLYGSAQRLKQDTGWQPQIELSQTIKDFVAAI